MKTKTTILFILATFVFVTIFKSCDENPTVEDPIKTTQDVGKDLGRSELLSNNVFSSTLQILQKTQDSLIPPTKALTSFGSCATLTIIPFDLITFPKTLTLNFDTAGCVGTDGVFRKGQVVVNATAWLVDSNAVVSVQANNYVVNDKTINGTKVITNLGRNVMNNIHFNVVTNLNFVTPAGNSSSQSNRFKEWFAGESTPTKDDDEYKISGTSSGTTVAAQTYTVNILTPLHIKNSCNWVVAGKLEVITGTLNFTIDYGDGTCDNIAVLTFQGNNFNITMN